MSSRSVKSHATRSKSKGPATRASRKNEKITEEELIIEEVYEQPATSKRSTSKVASKPTSKTTASKPSGSKGAEAPSNALHVGQLSFDTTEELLRELFEQYGTIVSITLPKRFDDRIKGFGFVEFETAAEAENALAANDTELLGKKITVQKKLGRASKPDKPFQGPKKRNRARKNQGPRRDAAPY